MSLKAPTTTISMDPHLYAIAIQTLNEALQGRAVSPSEYQGWVRRLVNAMRQAVGDEVTAVVREMEDAAKTEPEVEPEPYHPSTCDCSECEEEARR